MEREKQTHIVEAALLAAGGSVSLDGLLALFAPEDAPERGELRAILDELAAEYESRGIEIHQTGSGWRIQVRREYAPWVSRLWEERPARYSRALMETLALIAYRQPITRGEIEDIRGVSVSTQIVKTLLEREWVRVVGQRDVPGKPSLYATTKTFLDYFGLKSLDDLPTLAEIRDLEEINRELELETPVDDQEGQDSVSMVVAEEVEVTEAAEEEAVDAQAEPGPESEQAVAADGDDRLH